MTTIHDRLAGKAPRLDMDFTAQNVAGIYSTIQDWMHSAQEAELQAQLAGDQSAFDIHHAQVGAYNRALALIQERNQQNKNGA